jgi:hypothetical protein
LKYQCRLKKHLTQIQKIAKIVREKTHFLQKIMSLLYSGSSSPNNELEVLIWAVGGGFAVFFGLLIEKFADWMNDGYSFPPYKPHKTLGELGWGLLMIGILIEISDAGYTAIDVWQNAPLNQPINAATATASIHVKGTNFLNISDFDKFPNNHSVSLSFMRAGQETWKLHLICRSSERWGGKDDTWWNLEFGEEPEAPRWNLRANDLVRSADEWDIVWLDAIFIRSDADILGGEVRLLMNGQIEKNFPIPPQKPEPLFGIAYRDLPVMDGTTSNKVNVRVVGTPGPPIKK